MVFKKIAIALVLVQLANSAIVTTYSKANLDFSSDLFHHVIDGKDGENVVISPVSVQTCMAMAFFGAKGNTADEMVKGLHFTTSDKAEIASRAEKLSASVSPLLKLANRIYLDKHVTIKPNFNEIVKKSFKAEAESLDFSKADESAAIVNKWVESNTNDKIKNIVQPSNLKSGSMVLVNAIHFKGEWENKFDTDIKKNDFWLNDKTSVQVDMMSNHGRFNYAEWKELDSTVLEMQYHDSDFSMLIMLPNKREGLSELESKIHDLDLMHLSSQMKLEKVDVKLPKFKVDFETSLVKTLQDMGMTTMFTDSADFSDLVDADVHVSDVIHKATITVDEHGTEAAAATIILMVGSSYDPTKPKEFIADHPFVFAIKDKQAIYFIGRVAKL